MKGKQDNAFVFVALRGPELPQPRPNPSTPPGSSVPIPIDPGDDGFVDRIRRLTETSGDLQESRTTVATEFMNSTDYVPRNPSWRPWLILEGPIATLLARADTPRDFSGLRSALEQLLSRHFNRPFDIREFAGGDEFRKMRTDFWRSYYANVSLRTRRAQDLPLLEFWIKAFEVMKNLAVEWGSPAPASIDALRLTVPFLLVQEKPAPPDPPDAPALPSRRRQEIVRTKSGLAELKAAEAELKNLFQSRMAQFPASITPAQVTSVRTSSTAGESLDDPPEQLTISTSDLSAPVRAALAREHVEVANRPIPSIIDTVQRKIAQAYLRLHDLQRVTEVVLSNGVFVRRRRISIDRASEEAR